MVNAMKRARNKKDRRAQLWARLEHEHIRQHHGGAYCFNPAHARQYFGGTHLSLFQQYDRFIREHPPQLMYPVDTPIRSATAAMESMFSIAEVPDTPFTRLVEAIQLRV